MKNTYTRISQETAKQMLAEDDGHILVDVRRPDEFAAGHIPGAICVPNESIGEEPPALLPDRDAILLLYCRSGNRSRQAAQKLVDLGYTNVYEFGGILDWTDEIVTDAAEPQAEKTILIDIGGTTLTVVCADNSSADALWEKLEAEPLELTLHDYGSFEKVGPLPWKLPTNDERITTVPGDLILYQGDQITIYYDENTWNFTRLGHIADLEQTDLKALLGEGSVTVRFRAG